MDEIINIFVYKKVNRLRVQISYGQIFLAPKSNNKEKYQRDFASERYYAYLENEQMMVLLRDVTHKAKVCKCLSANKINKANQITNLACSQS